MTNYACSDIHGLKERYDHMMEYIKEEDTLYLLGDVIDRGKDGIAILLDVMKRKNVVMLLGNHEYMMKQYYDAKYDLIKDPMMKKEVTTRWKMNHSEPTRQAFEKLPNTTQEEILKFIAQLPVIIADLHINDQIYYLVHGCPIQQLHEGTWNCQDIEKQGYMIESAVWNRMEGKEKFFNDRCVIVGHTPTLYYQSCMPYEIWYRGASCKDTDLINIDCGCAANNAGTQLALFNLDNREVRYF